MHFLNSVAGFDYHYPEYYSLKRTPRFIFHGLSALFLFNLCPVIFGDLVEGLEGFYYEKCKSKFKKCKSHFRVR